MTGVMLLILKTRERAGLAGDRYIRNRAREDRAMDNRSWWQAILDRGYKARRIGLQA